MLVKMYQLKLNYVDIVEEHYYDTESEALEILKDLLMYYNQYNTIEMAVVVRDIEQSCFEDISREVLYTIVNQRKEV